LNRNTEKLRVFSADLAARQPFAVGLIEAQVATKRLPGAYLLTGRAHDDKIELAKHLISALNCARRAESDDLFCLVGGGAAESWCPDCRWIAQEEHPQAWQMLSGDETKTGKIPVEKARALSEELSKTSQYCRGVIVKEASEEFFHRPAANALLKTIEEPKGRIVFLFCSLTASDVLKTVVSRCQIVELSLLQARQNADGKTDSEGDLIQRILGPALGDMKELGHKHGRHHKLPLEIAANLALAMQELVGQEVELADILDFLVAEEIRSLEGRLARDPAAVTYAHNLMQSSERAKNHSDHFVSEKAIIDAFAFRWAAVKEKFMDQAVSFSTRLQA
jgi:DNA polymerase III, delta subunit